MLVAIKPHSTIKKYFNGDNLKVDLSCYADVLDYIRSMHPAFAKYMHTQSVNGLQETFTLLDKNLRELSADELTLRRPRRDDVIHIVPAVIGGGGKRGAIAMLAIAALAVFAPYLLAASGAFGAAATTASVGAMTTLGGLTTIGTLSSTIGMNLALMAVTMLLAPKAAKTDSSRDNNAFGSLTNTTNSGVAVALHFGQVRVAGQLITGHTVTVDKANGDDVRVQDITNS